MAEQTAEEANPVAQPNTTVHDVSKYILRWFADKGEENITQWKLHKLLYYCQAWSLVWDEEPVFPEEIQAWANGPVCPELYRVHKGKFRLGPEDIAGAPENLTEEQKSTVDSVLEFYGNETGRDLSYLTHTEGPWSDVRVRAGLGSGDRGNAVIEFNDMAQYYGGLNNGTG